MPYIDESYEPTATDVLCAYHLEPCAGGNMRQAAEELCKKSSVDLAGGPRVENLAATAYRLGDDAIKVAFPAELFEPGNIPQMLTIIAGKIFGLERIGRLRLQDVCFPEWWIHSFSGSAYGTNIIEKFFDSPARPLVCSMISPEIGLDLETYVDKADASFMGGCDMVRDSPQIANSKKNPFDERVKRMLALAKDCAQSTGMPKSYFPNVSGPGEVVLRRIDLVLKAGGHGVVVDFHACGFATLQMVRNNFPELIIYADRTSHAATARDKRHGISMTTLGKFARLAGADLTEIGSITGDMVETEAHVVQLHANLLADIFRTRDPERFDQDWYGQGNSLPVTSGGLTADDIRGLRYRFGNHLVLQFGRSMTGIAEVTREHIERFLDELGPLVPLV